jgi:hypothetical protein
MKLQGIDCYPFVPNVKDMPDILGESTPKQFVHTKFTDGCIFGQDLLKRSGIYKRNTNNGNINF